VQRLVDYLLEKNGEVLIHIDLKERAVFESFIKKNEGRTSLQIFSRWKVYWGSFNQIEATFFLLSEALKTGAGSFSLLSGQDLPIKPLEKFRQFISEHSQSSFLSFHKVDESGKGNNEWRNRLAHYWITDFSPSFGFLFNKLNVILHWGQDLLGWRKTQDLPLFAGPNWFTINREAAVYVCRYISDNPHFYLTFKNSRLADEIILQTILLNSPLKEKITNDFLRYVDWQKGPDHPRVFTVEDATTLKDAPGFFARKFDEKRDETIIHTIYSQLR
jgi:hypothetical protein